MPVVPGLALLPVAKSPPCTRGAGLGVGSAMWWGGSEGRGGIYCWLFFFQIQSVNREK